MKSPVLSKSGFNKMGWLDVPKDAAKPVTLQAENGAFDLLHSSISFIPSTKRLATYAKILQEEVFKRCRSCWPISSIETGEEQRFGSMDSPTILLTIVDEIPGVTSREGFEIKVNASLKSIMLSGMSDRGVLFAVGRFLREIRMDMHEAYASPLKQVCCTFPELYVRSSPDYKMRMHQIGFRPKTNSYDHFTVGQMKQEILDLALFGTNGIEMLPPGIDDSPQSPHFKVDWLAMIFAASGWCDDLDIDVSIWYPLFFKDYKDPETLKKAKKHWHDIFNSFKRLDHLFVPGGDPGGRVPADLFSILEVKSAFAKKHHFPNVKVWVSSQFGLGTSVDIGIKWWDIVKQEDDFFALLNTDRVKSFLHGVVYSPWSSSHIDKFRASVPTQYPIRNYPDICHTASCQNPVDGWDVAFFVTNLRENVNPRPSTFARVVSDQSKYTIGAGCYSEGVSDDINKYVWTLCLWGGDISGPLAKSDPDTVLRRGINQYGSMHIGLPRLSNFVEEGIFALEKNWHSGPILLTDQIKKTFKIWKEIERNLVPRHMHNWRLNMCLFKAYYDMFIASRLGEEDRAGAEALSILVSGGESLSPTNLAKAIDSLDKTYENDSISSTFPRSIAKLGGGSPNAVQLNDNATVGFLYARLQTLAGILYEQIGLQLSIEYGGQHRQRGAYFDCAWTPLGDVQYLKRLVEESRQKLAQNRAAGSSFFWENVEPLLLSGGYAESPKFKGSKVIWHGSFGDMVHVGAEIASMPEVIYPHKKFDLGDDPNYFQRPLVEQIASDNDEVLKALENGLVPRSWRSWLVTMWPHIEIKFRFPLSAVSSRVPTGEKLYVRMTYAGLDILDLGGDWQELGRATEDAKLICNGHEIHGFMSSPKTTTAMDFYIPDEIIASDSSGYLTFQLVPRNAIKMRYTRPLLPACEMALLAKGSAMGASKL